MLYCHCSYIAKMLWGKQSKSYTVKESREKNQFKDYLTLRSPKQTVKVVHTDQNRSMELNNLKQESFQEFYKVYRPREPL